MRTHCELCGVKLKFPENDYRKTAMCQKCVRGEMKGLMEMRRINITSKTKPFGLKVK